MAVHRDFGRIVPLVSVRFPVSPLRGVVPNQRVSSEARSIGRRQIRAHERNRRRLRNRRIKAVLAGGLVFGIGAAATVAAWTDTESASGSFEAGTFNIDLSVNGSWDNSSEMTFDASGMYPGSTVYAPVFVRTTPDTTMDGDLRVSNVGASGNTNSIAGYLEYRTVTKSIDPDQMAKFKAGCTASAFTGSSSYVFGSPSAKTPLKTPAAGTGTQNLSKGAGAVRAFCFEVTLPTNTPNGAQGTAASNIWKFDAESVPTKAS